MKNTPIETTETPEYVSAQFLPKEDITAFELASLMPYLLGASLTFGAWVDLGEMQRHFKRTG